MVLDKIPGTKLFKQGDVRETNVSGVNKESYMSMSPAAFHGVTPDTDQITKTSAETTADANGISFIAQVNLPHGAVITKVVVNASISDESWDLVVNDLDGTITGSTASGNFNTTVTNIDINPVDNKNKSLVFTTSSLDSTDEIWGALITYTTDFI